MKNLKQLIIHHQVKCNCKYPNKLEVSKEAYENSGIWVLKFSYDMGIFMQFRKKCNVLKCFHKTSYSVYILLSQATPLFQVTTRRSAGNLVILTFGFEQSSVRLIKKGNGVEMLQIKPLWFKSLKMLTLTVGKSYSETNVSAACLITKPKKHEPLPKPE